MTWGIQLSLFKLFSWSSQLRALDCTKDTKAMHALSLPRVSFFLSSFCWLSNVKEEINMCQGFIASTFISESAQFTEEIKEPPSTFSFFFLHPLKCLAWTVETCICWRSLRRKYFSMTLICHKKSHTSRPCSCTWRVHRTAMWSRKKCKRWAMTSATEGHSHLLFLL